MCDDDDDGRSERRGGAAGSSNFRRAAVVAAAQPVVVAYFVPSVEELVKGMERAYGLLGERKVKAVRRMEGTFEEREWASRERWDEYSREYGGGGAVVGDGDGKGCADLSTDEDGKMECLRLNETRARVRSKFRAEWEADGLVGTLDG